MLRSLVLAAARSVPAPFKRWIHRSRLLDRIARGTFASLMGAVGSIATIESGPMKGMALVVSQHVSHAHIAGTYELETQLAVDRLVVPGSVCYDLGASIGYLSLLMARKAKHVYAFEPAPHAAAELRRHAAANRLENITVVPSPVSDSKRTVEFSITDGAYGSRIVEGETKWPVEKLKAITLDEFASAHPFPDFIKIDVEDEEGRVLAGAHSLLDNGSTVICCELHSEQAARDVERILSAHGYRLTGLNGEPFRIVPPIVPGDVQVLAFPAGRHST